MLLQLLVDVRVDDALHLRGIVPLGQGVAGVPLVPVRTFLERLGSIGRIEGGIGQGVREGTGRDR